MGVGERAAAGIFRRMVFPLFGAELKPRPNSRHGGRAPNVFAVGSDGDARCNSCLEWPNCFKPTLRIHANCVWMGLLCADCACRGSVVLADGRAESGLSQRDRHLDQHNPGTTAEW